MKSTVEQGRNAVAEADIEEEVVSRRGIAMDAESIPCVARCAGSAADAALQ